jgi:hypothetical protein
MTRPSAGPPISQTSRATTGPSCRPTTSSAVQPGDDRAARTTAGRTDADALLPPVSLFTRDRDTTISPGVLPQQDSKGPGPALIPATPPPAAPIRRPVRLWETARCAWRYRSARSRQRDSAQLTWIVGLWATRPDHPFCRPDRTKWRGPLTVHPPRAAIASARSANDVSLVEDHRHAITELVDKLARRAESDGALVEEDEEPVAAPDEGGVAVVSDIPPGWSP